jgi:hypothetical protein
VNPTPPTPTVTYNAGVLTSSAATGNQWYLNGNIIPGATGQTFTPTQDGVYTVKVTLSGCTSPASPGSTIAGVGLDELTQGTFNLYPNPSNGVFTFSFDADVNESYTVEVYDEMGKVVFTDKFNQVSGTFQKEINLGKVATGIYTVSLKGKNAEVNRKLVIK